MQIILVTRHHVIHSALRSFRINRVFSHTLGFVLSLEIKSWVHLSREYLELFTRQGFILKCSKFANVILHFRGVLCCANSIQQGPLELLVSISMRIFSVISPNLKSPVSLSVFCFPCWFNYTWKSSVSAYIPKRKEPRGAKLQNTLQLFSFVFTTEVSVRKRQVLFPFHLWRILMKQLASI